MDDTSTRAGLTTAPAHAPSYPLVGSLPFMVGDFLDFLLRASEAGSIVDLRVPTQKLFLLREPEDIEYVLLTGNRSVVKDRTRQLVKRYLGNGLLLSEGDFWRQQRRRVQPAFHRERIEQYAKAMVASSVRLRDEMRVGETRNLLSDFLRTTLDIVAETLFGSTLGEDAPAMGAAVSTILAYYSSSKPFVIPGYDRLPIPQNFRLRAAFRTLDEIALRVIERRRNATSGERGDLLSMLIDARDDDGKPMTTTQLRDEVLAVILAGHETSATALGWTFALLAQHPEIDAALFEAIAFLEGRTPTLDDLPRLSFVENVISEALRLYPPAHVLGREVVEPFTLRGVTLPRGAQLFLTPWVTHRDARWFPEPNSFRPSRWADGLAKRLPRFAYFPFGGGPRLCVGNTYAMMEMTLLVTTLAQRYRFDLAPGLRLEPVPSISMRPRDGLLPMTVHARPSRN